MRQKKKGQRYLYWLLHESINLEPMSHTGTICGPAEYFQLLARKFPSFKRKLVVTFHEVWFYTKRIDQVLYFNLEVVRAA